MRGSQKSALYHIDQEKVNVFGKILRKISGCRCFTKGSFLATLFLIQLRKRTTLFGNLG